MKRMLFDNFTNRILFLAVIASSSVSSIFAYEYKVASIPDSLKEGAVAVVRNFSAVYTQNDMNNATYKVTKVITILNDKGNDHAHFYSYSDNFTDFKKFEGVIRDGEGKEIKKIRKSDLVVSSFSEYMATDTYSLSYKVYSPIYPYTVEYSYEQRFKEGICAYPMFRPISGTMESVEKATYIVELPLDLDLRYKSGFDCKIEKSKTDKNHIYTFSSGSIKCIKYEPLAPNFEERIPTVKVAPNNFIFDKIDGNMSSWQNYGIWLNKLLDGRDYLPTQAVEKIKNVVGETTDKREIVRVLYKYLQENSRYVNISLGIGGFQPIPAESVFKNRYGDCKGLSNVMKAMLKAVDISSNYCEIYSGQKKTLDVDFFDMAQTNHAILLVPFEKDSIWLECTSQTLPFGYIHKNIEGHDALVVTDSGGVLCKLPSYSSADNLTKSVVSMDVNENGEISASVQFTEYLHGYASYHYSLKSNDRDIHVKYINNSINLPQIRIGKIETSEKTSDRPECTISAEFKAVDAVNKTGDRMFIPLCPLKKSNYNIFSSKTREYDIVVANGYSVEDSVTVNIPKGYAVESIPKSTSLITPFGVLNTILTNNGDGTVSYKQMVVVFQGRYSKDAYNDFKEFFKQIGATAKRQIVVKKI